MAHGIDLAKLEKKINKILARTKPSQFRKFMAQQRSKNKTLRIIKHHPQ